MSKFWFNPFIRGYSVHKISMVIAVRWLTLAFDPIIIIIIK